MGLFSFLKRKKKTASESGDSGRMDLSGVDLSETPDLETRYTQEYSDYLASQETLESREATCGQDGGEDGAAAD